MIQPSYKAPKLLSLYRSGDLLIVVLYLVTGMITSVTDYTLFVTFLNIIPIGLLVATVISYVGGLIVNFTLSRFIVYRTPAKGQHLGTSVWRYGTLLVINLIITYLMLWAMQSWFGLSPLLGKFVVWFFMTFWIFAMNRLWVFKGPRQLKSEFYFAGRHRIKRRR